MSEGWKLVVGALAVWRLSHLLHAEDGPADLLVRLRRRAGDGLWGKMLDCFQCLSLWVAAPVASWVGESWLERALIWPALSGAAILLERLTRRPEPPVAWFEEEAEESDGMLRKGTQRSADDESAGPS